MRRMILGLTLLAFFAGCVLSGVSFAGEIDLLVDKLVEKDVISPVEAQILLDETKQSVSKEIATGQSSTLPSWVQKMKFKGDLRVRYQTEEKDTIAASGATTTAKQERARLRLRLGGEANVATDWKAYWRLDSGGTTDPRSTNATMEDNFAAKGITIGQAYMEYSPLSEAKLVMGKMDMAKVLWTNSDMLWDGDINPEGGAVSLSTMLNPNLSGWLNTSYLVIDTVSTGADPSLVIIQPGLTWDIDSNMTLKGSVNYYAFNGIEGSRIGNIVAGGATNSTSTTPASYQYDYDSMGLSAEFGLNLQEDAEVRELVNYVGLYGDYINNSDPADENTGFLYGFKFGDKKVSEQGTWQAKVQYCELEKDGWVDFLSDSDRLSGKTNVKSLELILEYALAKGVTLGLDYYLDETLNVPAGSSKTEQSLLQVDCVVKF